MTARALAMAVLLACMPGAVAEASPPPNSVSHWGEIAQNTVVSSGAFQNEGLVYMAYVSAAVYDAATSIQGGYEPYRFSTRAGVRLGRDVARYDLAHAFRPAPARHGG